jgi:uncharacterized membrane protein
MMKVTNKKRMSTETMVLGAIMTALVILLQCLATYTTFFGPFSTAIGLIPIAIGAALCGPAIGAWLGSVFGAVVLLTGGGALFWAFDPFGTIVTVMAKGIACGLAAGLVYLALKKCNNTVAAIAAAIVCPIVNTGVFLLGCAVFFLPHGDAIAATVGMDVSGMALFLAFAFGNFLFEIGMNAVLSPVLVRLLALGGKRYGVKRGEG